jgi:hypothetical protein
MEKIGTTEIRADQPRCAKIRVMEINAPCMRRPSPFFEAS